ncbi:hypothetical protein [Candidatus Odyssella acanthamoebae]|uniref:Uncharacterized protein n=1 Tax=Candidatus Odyssella acanthamoebae TaxID=91604 RepID=A0A077B0E4_9PROT|nr:hypothetical protein [Candidatus Paracaedibacter acanthamoebae]AIK96410.1 hypothetical protein ID47_06160 [Candidatus Paracaedibacter acanthamoebae]
MSIYLYKCNPLQSFSADCEQLPVKLLELVIDHKEGRVAVATLVLPISDLIPAEGWAFIVTDDRGHLEPIFKGQFVGLPKKIDEVTKIVELVATPVDLGHQVSALTRNLKESHPDCLLLRGQKQLDLADYLEFRQELFCYDRVTHQMTLSSLFQGTHQQTFQTQILQGSLQFRICDTPLPAVSLSVVCEWVQECQGEINLIPKIELQFSQGRINTLSPKSLSVSWPKAGKTLGRSGYEVLRSSLKEFTPPSTGSLGHYPTITPLIHGKRYRQHWFQGELILGWTYRQKRREQVDVVVHHQNQYLGFSKRPVRKLKLKLNKLTGDMQSHSSFFETTAGRQAILSALNIAKSHLAYSSRAAEVRFQVEFVNALDITLDHQLKICHESLPAGRITGKVTSCRLERRFDRAVAHLTVAVATGAEEERPFVLNWGYKDDLLGFEKVSSLTADHFIESLTVENHVRDQINWLQDQEQPVSSLPPEAATSIDFTFKDLRSSDVLERKFRLHDLYWSAPNQLGTPEEEA